MEVECKLYEPNVDYSVKLSEEDVKKLQSQPLEVKVLEDLSLSQKDFRLQVSAPDDDSEFELHYHPPIRSWGKIKNIHATMSNNSYEELKRNKRLFAKHDHGIIDLVII